MNALKASDYIDNMLGRLEELPDGRKQWNGPISHKELESLVFAVQFLGEAGNDKTYSVQKSEPEQVDFSEKSITTSSNKILDEKPEAKQLEIPVDFETGDADEITIIPVLESSHTAALPLVTSSLNLPDSPSSARICIDFGTAMSKATLVYEDETDEFERIVVLPVGAKGNQRVINEYMLVSSVYIANNGSMFFGDAAIEVSNIDAGDERQRLDNIKRRISEEGLDEKLNQRFNPTGIEITYRDIVLAYLMYLTWTINKCTDEEGFQRNIERRFAMPCLSQVKRIEVERLLRGMLGEAQVLADTFEMELESEDGIELATFHSTLVNLRNEKLVYPFVSNSLTEPLGVMGSITNWQSDINRLFMIVDIGAGTSDYSLFRINIDNKNNVRVANEIRGSSQGITEAGNYLDLILTELIIKKSGISVNAPAVSLERWKLEREMRENKEALFNNSYLSVELSDGSEVEIQLEEFLALPQVEKFSNRLREKMVEILESVNSDVIDWVQSDPRQKLVIVLTGGGANLPMVQSLVDGSLEVHGNKLITGKALAFPTWLKEDQAELEDDYARIAVSLGGARENILLQGGAVSVHPTDAHGVRTLGGFY